MTKFNRILSAGLIGVVLLSALGGAIAAPKPDEVAKVTAALPAKAPAKPAKARKLLVFKRCEGFRHSSIPVGCKALELMGQKTGAYSTVVSDDMSVFTAEKLKEFDAVLFNNTTRLKFKNPEHRKALMEFVKSGKGVVGIHAATDNFYTWPEAAEMMGGLFAGHPWGAGGTWAVKLDEPGHTLNKTFGGKGFKIKDEIYKFRNTVYSRKKLRVLVSLDMSDAKTCSRGNKDPKRDIPITWVNKVGKGRVFYCSLGHNHSTYWNANVLAHYLGGIQYAMGDLKIDDCLKTAAGVAAAAASAGECTLCKAAPADAVQLVGDTLDTWKGQGGGDTGKWRVIGDVGLDPASERKLAVKAGKGIIDNGGRTKNLLSKAEFGDIEAHIEFMVSKGSNSGVYFQGRYEIQVLDSWGVKKLKHGDCGGIYQRWGKNPSGKMGYEGVPPRVNASRKPGQWQTFDVIFRAARFDKDGKKTENAKFIKVVHNGIVVHENRSVTGPTRASTFNDEKALGPLMLQGDHGPVAYRNIWIAKRKL
jgi:type 1 glutamine amidotransferase